MNTNVLFAVFRRNFVSYFSSPTGYVFIVAFLWLIAGASIIPPGFWNANLANLDQLSYWFPLVMLLFVPAITMSIWADERRQGTDELVLTIPAGDFDIVLGKYLAAVAIFTVSLVYSMTCYYIFLQILGSPDGWLFLSTVFGYWLIGLAMLAIGMVASFLTGNVTVSYVLGALFNLPLVALVWSYDILPSEMARVLKQWSISEQFRDFGNGVISFSGIAYFLSIVAVMLYLSMILIGRRHWNRGGDWFEMGSHYIVRTVALVAAVVGIVGFFQLYNLRADVTAEKLNTLSPKTVELLEGLDLQRPVQIEAFVSPEAEVPESYVQPRLNLLSLLREIEAICGSNVQVRVHETGLIGDQATRAKDRYGIEPRQVITLTRGKISDDRIFMGVAMNCGLEKVVLPFIDRGLPMEYEIVRSLGTVTQQKRKKVGVLRTDAQIFGQFNMQTMSSEPAWPIIDELKKQYEVVEVDPTEPIVEKYDVLLAVQPSAMGPEQTDNFIAAVKAGQPTAIFEDPFPITPRVPGTTRPRPPAGGGNPMMGMMGGNQPQPKGDIGKLWDLLGVSFVDNKIVWQDYRPSPRLEAWPSEVVFIGSTEEGVSFNEEDPMTSGLQIVALPFPGSITPLHTSQLETETLMQTMRSAGTVPLDQMTISMPFMGETLNPRRPKIPSNDSYALAVYIHGDLNSDKATDGADDTGAEGDKGEEGDQGEAKAEESKDDEKKEDKKSGIQVVLVSDIDLLHRHFFNLREHGIDVDAGVDYSFDNVTLVLNILDILAGDDRFVEIRKRRPVHRTLTKIEEFVEEVDKKTTETRREFLKERETAEKEFEENFTKMIDELQEAMDKQNLSEDEANRRAAMRTKAGQKRKQAQIDQADQRCDAKIREIELSSDRQRESFEATIKAMAVALPPLPLLLLGLGVFFARRAGEQEGVEKTRLR